MCGVVNRWDQAAEIRHTCDACAATWDQDENAAQNILVRGCERFPGAPDPAGARNEEVPMVSKTSRFAKAKAAKAERIVAESARNQFAKSAE